ncbi:MAG: FAD binding domain-containing protein [Clostridium sp.]
MNFKNYLIPSSLEMAHEGLINGGKIIAGGAFSHTSKANVDLLVDISKLNLKYINEGDDFIEIGAMTTLSEIQENKLLNSRFNNIFEKCFSKILGIQIRNVATIGGSICGRYGFSDVITTLLPLNPILKFYNYGEITLNEYLSLNIREDILEKIIIKGSGKAAFSCIRNSQGSFSTLNCSIAIINNKVNIAVGSRPQVAKMVSVDYRDNIKEVQESILRSIREIELSSNKTATKAYRERVVNALVERCLKEVI